MKSFDYPKKAAYKLAVDMQKFLARTEETAHSEINPRADQDRAEVVRQIDWAAFNKVIKQLSFCYLQDKKYKVKTTRPCIEYNEGADTEY